MTPAYSFRRAVLIGLAAVPLLLAACSSEPSAETKRKMEEQKRAKAQADLQKLYDKFLAKGSEPVQIRSLNPYLKAGRDMALAPLPQENAPASAPSTSPAPSPIAAPIPVVGQVIHTQAELSELIRRSGYQVHADTPGALMYFDGLTPSDTAKLNYPLPQGLHVFYYIDGDKIVLAADIRGLRPTEITALQANPERTATPAVTFLQQLNEGIPFFLNAGYFTAELPIAVNGTAVKRQELVLVSSLENKDLNTDSISGAITLFILALTPHQEVWR
jgi:hypothetical protein